VKWVRDHGLTLFFTALFLASLVGQALVGHSDFNHDQLAHGDAPLSLERYVTSSAYWVDVTENWQSEYLQFSLMILATVWLMQRGSTESKPEERLGPETDSEQKLGEHAEPDSPKWARAGGWRRSSWTATSCSSPRPATAGSSSAPAARPGRSVPTTARSRRGEPVKSMFAMWLSLIVVGLAYFVTIGLLHR